MARPGGLGSGAKGVIAPSLSICLSGVNAVFCIVQNLSYGTSI
jgi:hypothetical protein